MSKAFALQDDPGCHIDECSWVFSSLKSKLSESQLPFTLIIYAPKSLDNSIVIISEVVIMCLLRHKQYCHM